MGITPALEDYLEAILILKERTGTARVKDVAAFLEVRAPSVIDALGHLKRKKYVLQKPYGTIDLTAKGWACARDIYARHKDLKKFFSLIVGLQEGMAEAEACKIEHYLDRETIKKMLRFTNDYIASRQEIPATKNEIKTYTA